MYHPLLYKSQTQKVIGALIIHCVKCAYVQCVAMAIIVRALHIHLRCIFCTFARITSHEICPRGNYAYACGHSVMRLHTCLRANRKSRRIGARRRPRAPFTTSVCIASVMSRTEQRDTDDRYKRKIRVQ